MPNDFKYEVFLSHSSKDKLVVRELANRLKKDTLRVWFDESDSLSTMGRAGVREEALESSRVLVLCMPTVKRPGATDIEAEATITLTYYWRTLLR